MVSYMFTIQMESLFLVVFEIYEKKAIWPFDLGSRSKVMTPNESPYNSFLCVYNTNGDSIYRSFWDIWEKEHMTFWPWSCVYNTNWTSISRSFRENCRFYFLWPLEVKPLDRFQPFSTGEERAIVDVYLRKWNSCFKNCRQQSAYR